MNIFHHADHADDCCELSLAKMQTPRHWDKDAIVPPGVWDTLLEPPHEWRLDLNTNGLATWTCGRCSEYIQQDSRKVRYPVSGSCPNGRPRQNIQPCRECLEKEREALAATACPGGCGAQGPCRCYTAGHAEGSGAEQLEALDRELPFGASAPIWERPNRN